MRSIHRDNEKIIIYEIKVLYIPALPAGRFSFFIFGTFLSRKKYRKKSITSQATAEFLSLLQYHFHIQEAGSLLKYQLLHQSSMTYKLNNRQQFLCPPHK